MWARGGHSGAFKREFRKFISSYFSSAVSTKDDLNKPSSVSDQKIIATLMIRISLKKTNFARDIIGCDFKIT